MSVTDDRIVDCAPAFLHNMAAEAMVDVYANTRSTFTVDNHDHYLFNPRDLLYDFKRTLAHLLGRTWSRRPKNRTTEVSFGNVVS